MHEIKLKINGNGTISTGFVDRLKLGTANELNRVKMVFDVDETIEGTYQYIKFLKNDISYIYRVNYNEIIINRSILASAGVWMFSFISTNAPISNRQLTGSYAFITEPIEVVVVDGILQKGNDPEELAALRSLYAMDFSDLIIPDDIEIVGDYFLYNSNLEFNLHIGKSVKSIGSYAFYDAIIDNLTFDKECELTTLNDYAFNHIIFSMDEVVIPKNVTSWGKYCFRNSEGDTLRFEEGSKLTTLGSYAFWDVDFYTIILPEGLQTFSGGTYVIKNCGLLNYLYIPSTLTAAIPNNAIYGCDNLEYIALGEDFAVSADFSNCTNLSEICMINMFHSLKDLTGEASKSFILGDTNLKKLTDEDYIIATNKNWVLM